MGLQKLCLVLALICFVLGALGVPAKVSWTNVGLALFTASLLL